MILVPSDGRAHARTPFLKGVILVAAAVMTLTGVDLAAASAAHAADAVPAPPSTSSSAPAAAEPDPAPAACPTSDIAQGKTATASSVNGGNTAADAFDGDAGTRWESAQGADPQWLQVDLGSSQGICGVSLTWEAAAASAYYFQTSQDGTTWSAPFGNGSATGAGTQAISFDPAQSGRYLRLTGTARTTPYGYSLYAFQVFSTGPDGNDVAPAQKACAAGTATTVPDAPDFGPNVTILNSGMPVSEINSALASVSGEGEFSSNRHAVFFLPGSYGCADGSDGSQTSFQQYLDGDSTSYADVVNGAVGYYETVAGLGASPDDVTINGAVHADGVASHTAMPWAGGESALTNFWRSLSNVSINPIQKPTDADLAANSYTADEFPGAVAGSFPEGTEPAGQLGWAVSQAAPLRRVDIHGNLSLFPAYGGFSSGGFLADSKVSGQVISGSQQQWYTRDSEIGSWNGSVWNMVFSGVQGAPAPSFPTPPFTTLPTTPESREAPFLYVDGGAYKVFVPDARADSSGVDWSTDASAGRSLPISGFFIAKPSDSVAAINSALASGKSLILTPGVYSYAQPIEVTHSDTVVLGLGMATLTPTAGNAALKTADITGAVITGITVDAGTTKSDVLVQIGPDGAHAADAADPTALIDVFIRVGGAIAGKAGTAIVVNSDDVILDDIWSWRADHGAGAAWDVNTADTGLEINGDDVTALGLFVEHYQKNQVIWNGNGGTTVFYQSELPYDVPDQASWSDGTRNGYASYKVADSVTSHHAYGLGVYSFFNQGIDIVEDAGIQAPTSPGVQFTDMVSRFLNGNGSIAHVINDTGAPVRLAQPGEDANAVETSYLASYPGPDTTAPTVAVTAAPGAPGASGWYTGPVTLTASASDDFSPAPTVQVSVDGGAWSAVSGPVTVGADGSHTVQFQATDSSGNTSQIASWTGRIDATAPAVSAKVDAKAGTVTLSASDAGSGVAGIQYSIGSSKANGSSSWSAYTVPVQVTGTKVVSYRATDAAGNVSAIGSVSVTHGTGGGSSGGIGGIVSAIVKAIAGIVSAILKFLF